MKDAITTALVLAACLVIGDKLWTIALAAALVAAAGIVQWRKAHGKRNPT